MTIKVPEPNIFDKLLRQFGKSRGVIIPENAHCFHGKENHMDCKKESLFKSLCRSRDKALPKDRADIFLLQKIYQKKNTGNGHKPH